MNFIDIFTIIIISTSVVLGVTPVDNGPDTSLTLQILTLNEMTDKNNDDQNYCVGRS